MPEVYGSPTIMIVDDEPYMRHIMSKMLSEAGFNTVEATGGRQALELISQTTPDLITLDILMPDMSGF